MNGAGGAKARKRGENKWGERRLHRRGKKQTVALETRGGLHTEDVIPSSQREGWGKRFLWREDCGRGKKKAGPEGKKKKLRVEKYASRLRKGERSEGKKEGRGGKTN